ncbi:putative short-chain dehydrogenases/reductase [Flagelloscypha sp. PMI_526]|nr:putative short-chain dehydrogenases/reductase [Flagelloscypha sp. PMI_526]
MATILIIGAGENIGLSTAKRFASAGYKVALASRTKPASTAHKHFVFDAAQPASVPSLFADVTASVGPPSVVVYNAADQAFQKTMDINSTSAFVAGKEAVKAWATTGTKGTFVFTGNKLNVISFPNTLSFGMGKSASASLIRSAALGYKEKGYKFYYVDERTDAGDIVGMAKSGEAHAEHFIKLVEGADQGPWLQTFVKGKGYKAFNEIHE